MMDSRADRAPGWQIWLALLIVYIVWGSTYLAIRLTVETMPPLLAGSFRFLVAGVLMYGVLMLRSGPGVVRLTRPELKGSLIVGLLLLLGGNGLVMVGERDVPSGLAALIIAIVPLFVVLIRMAASERVRRGTLLGVLLGLVGVAVLILPRGIGGSVALVGMLLLIVASASWAYGSFLSRRLELPSDPFVATAAQLMLGGVGLGVAGLVTGELALLRWESFSTESVLSLAYLITFGSLLGYTAYTWLLANTSVSRVATYAYVNPVVAIILGWAILQEEVGLSILLGGAMIVLAVGVVIRSESRPGRAGELEAPPAQSALPEEAVEPEGADEPAPRPDQGTVRPEPERPS